ncbi:LysR family transcriptional regulator [Niveibacterium sp. SC-1]|uniref:LysR family transcriptional regulator n=1 Tax=Niveibacterium sp. SC-1 TaxID=3135646 RepID=UPI00311D2DCE
MQTPDRLGGVAVFVQVVESGSFARAAERLHLTRSAVAKTVARMEARLGARLFARSTRSLSLTEDGAAYHERCVRALAELQAAEDALDGTRRQPAGRLRLTAPAAFGRRCVLPTVSRLAAAHPQLAFDIAFRDQIANLVEERFDLAIRSGTPGPSAEVVARPVGKQWLGAYAAPAYLARAGEPLRARDLAEHQCIVYSRTGTPQPWGLTDEDGAPIELDVPQRLCMDDLEAMAEAAVAGFGVVRLPHWLAHDYVADGRLKPLLTYLPSTGPTLFLVWPSTRYLPLRTRMLIDALALELPALLQPLQQPA